MPTILNYYLIQFGFLGFILLKIFLSIAPVFIIEALRKKDLITKRKFEIYYSIVISIYVLVLLIGIVVLCLEATAS